MKWKYTFHKGFTLWNIMVSLDSLTTQFFVLTLTGCPGGQCSRYQFLTKGTSRALLDRPDLKLKGLGAHKRAMPFAVLSVYNGQSCKNGWQFSLNSNSSSSSGRKSSLDFETIRNIRVLKNPWPRDIPQFQFIHKAFRFVPNWNICWNGAFGVGLTFLISKWAGAL